MQIDRERLRLAINCAWIECDSLPPIVFTEGEADALCDSVIADLDAQGFVIVPAAKGDRK